MTTRTRDWCQTKLVQIICSNFHTQNITNNQVKVASSHPCGCDIIQLMKTGCICGGY